jgi:23S rRNA (cytosine1962-C5)-methyltransferase
LFLFVGAVSMFSEDQYALLDFGNGRKLERFGDVVLDRPAPAATRFQPSSADRWPTAHARYQRRSGRGGSGKWTVRKRIPDDWFIQHAELRFQLRLGESGNVGVFPEQAPNWDWITHQLQRASSPVRVLNLFAFTGGSTLSAAAAGAEVTHVDAARTAVQWARRNAELSQLGSASIRWIAEDATKFVRRELKRGQQYEALILDPPSYGHGPKGEPWKISQHLPGLLQTCQQLLSDRPCFVLITCHSPGFGPAELEALLADTLFGHCQSGARARRLALAIGPRRLPSGIVARWP